MKKLLRYICSGIFAGTLLLGNMAFAAYAQVERVTPDSPDYAELTVLTDRILNDINGLREYNDSGLYSDVTAEDIDWSQAYKIYVDESDIYASYAKQTMTYDQIQKSMSYYVWMLPVQADDAHLSITISKGLPLAENDPAREVLTEEEIRQVEADAGHWRPVETEELDYDKTAAWYEQKMADAYDGTVQRAFLMGGSPKMRSAVAVMETADGSIQIVPLEQPRLVGTLPKTRAHAEQPQAETVYSMKEMAAMLQPYVLDSDSELTGTGGADDAPQQGNPWVLLGVLCAGTFAMLCAGIWGKRA